MPTFWSVGSPSKRFALLMSTPRLIPSWYTIANEMWTCVDGSLVLSRSGMPGCVSSKRSSNNNTSSKSSHHNTTPSPPVTAFVTICWNDVSRFTTFEFSHANPTLASVLKCTSSCSNYPGRNQWRTQRDPSSSFPLTDAPNSRHPNLPASDVTSLLPSSPTLTTPYSTDLCIRTRQDAC